MDTETRNLLTFMFTPVQKSQFTGMDWFVQLSKLAGAAKDANTWDIVESNTCPKCGCESVNTIEYVRGSSELTIEGNKGDWESGSTEFDYNDSRTTVDWQGNVVLECADCNHEWAHPNLVTEAGVGNKIE